MQWTFIILLQQNLSEDNESALYEAKLSEVLQYMKQK
jgi:hypothetical protein